jgi:hypothetical protein
MPIAIGHAAGAVQSKRQFFTFWTASKSYHSQNA